MKKILLIEDNEEMRENTSEILELAGYNVITASHGKEGVSIASKEQIDLIVCDVMMPELDGYGVLHMLSRNPITASIPFIFLTAKAEKQDFRRGMNMGADDYITKPFEDVELLDAIEVRLKKTEGLHKEIPRDAEGIKNFFNEAKGQVSLKELSADREARYYRTKDVIYQEGNFPQALLFIAKGKVKTYKTNEDAKEYITNLHKMGDFLGYHALLSETAYTESAMALEDTEVLVIPKSDFFALVYNDRDVSHRFIRLLANDLEEREAQLLHLAYDTVRKRVADALLLLQKRYQDPNQKEFAMPISRENLANIVGTAKESVIRVLSEFKGDGLISTNQSEIKILDTQGLEKIRY
ncbi:MAG: response regulator [Bacteroidota bacterium]